jgi:8-oxo-dGTP pyrophosphatase MutT (NUDIX family)/ribosomal protein S18 acetylase RimI-like enzyme
LTSVRYALVEDLDRLAGIEDEADRLLVDHLLADERAPGGWPPPTDGRDRARRGSVLVAGQPVAGFVHLVELDGEDGPHWHLDQLSVHPSAGRRGIGRMLLHAAMGVAMDRGATDLTLTTFADVPWNAPWYRREGFVIVDETELRGHPVRRQRAAERDVGLDEVGPRVVMTRRLTDEPTPRPAVSVIPLRSSGAELEVFVQHRALTMDFVPGVVVFPGGRVDPRDEEEARRRGLDVARVCGVREVAEEAGALVDPDELVPWDRWVTPVGYPTRFDVQFFVLPVEDGVEFEHLTGEATHSEWVSVAGLVEATEADRVAMVPPTRTIVDELSAIGSLDAVLDLRPEVAAVRHDLTGPRPRH